MKPLAPTSAPTPQASAPRDADGSAAWNAVPAPEARDTAPTGARGAAPYAWAATRIALGWLFAWAFLDKTFGLGLSTPSGEGWIAGGNPTKGYLGSATGPLDGLYQGMAGGWLVNVLFMAGLLAVGVALLLGVASRLATIGGVVMVLLMWTSHLWPTTNPFLDEHLIYALVLVALLLSGADRTLGLGRRWAALPLVRRFSLLR